MKRSELFYPVFVFVAFIIIYAGSAAVLGKQLFFKPAWDIDHYRSIAAHGYEVYPCDPQRDYPLGDICGNVGWFPSWPLAVKLLSLGQVNTGILLLPYLFALAGMLLFYILLRRWYDSAISLLGTIALAATPTAFYFLTGFPYSFFLVLFAVYLLYLYDPKARWRAGILPLTAFLISLTYPTAILAAIIPAVYLLRQYCSLKRPAQLSSITRDLLYYLLPFAAGPLLLSLYFYFTFDDFLLIMHFQEKYYRNWGFPLLVIYRSLAKFSAHAPENWAIIWYGLIFFLFYPYRIKPELISYFLLFYLFSPATGSTFSIFRHYLLLFPAVMIIAAAPRPKWFKLAYIAFGLLLALVLFYPTYLRGLLI